MMPQIKNFEAFVKELDALKDSMDKLAVAHQKPIYDGPVQPEKYFNSKVKILWILKEAYDVQHNGAGGFEYACHIGQDELYNNFLKGQRYRATWYPIIYISYGILNNFALYDDIPYIEQEPSIADIIQSIAVINVNKLAGGTLSNASVINRIYNQNKDLLFHQIKVLQPDITIGGGTLAYFHELFNIKDMVAEKSRENTSYYYNSKQLFIHAKHPASRIKGKENFVSEPYVDDIIRISENYFFKYHKTG